MSKQFEFQPGPVEVTDAEIVKMAEQPSFSAISNLDTVKPANEVTPAGILERKNSDLAKAANLSAKIKGGNAEVAEKTAQENYRKGWDRIWGNKDSSDLEKGVAEIPEKQATADGWQEDAIKNYKGKILDAELVPPGLGKTAGVVVESATSTDTKIEASGQTLEQLADKMRAEVEAYNKTLGKRTEAKKLQSELEDARKNFASAEKNDPKYAEIQKDYQVKTEAMKSFVYEAKRSTLLKKGLSEADVEKELNKYTKEILAPNFAVAEAAKMQDEKADETMLEKVKDSKVSKMIYGAVENYRKLSFKQKILISAGLIGGAVVAGVAGGTAGAVIGGGVGMAKLAQRFLGGAGTAVGLEAWIQKSQQKWMTKEGWGRNRKEYVANEIHRLRAGVRGGEVKAESLEGVAGLEEVEKALEERKELEDKFEKRRTVLAGVGGVAVGSGAAFQAFKQFGEWTGANEMIFGLLNKVPGAEAVKGLFGGAKDQVSAVGSQVQEKILPIAIGVRGPEGALIDNFKAHPEMAKAFGWDGKSKLSEWAGAKAGELWNNDAKEALKNPKILAQMEKLGFSKDADGYAKMAHRIGKGFLQIDPTGKGIKFTDMEYLKNTSKELKALLETGERVVPAEEFLKGTTQRVFTTAGPSGVKPITDFVNQGLTPEQSNPLHSGAAQGNLKPITDFVNEGLTQEQKNPLNSFSAPKDVLMEGYVNPTEQISRATQGAEVPMPEIEVKNIVSKTETVGGSTVETTGYESVITGSTGRELLSKDYMSKLKLMGGDIGLTRNMLGLENRNILAQVATYNKLLSDGKIEEASKHLAALHKSVELADKSFGIGVIDHSKIPGMK